MEGQAAKNETSSPDWPPWAKAWGGLVVIAFQRRTPPAYDGALRELRAHQLSSWCWRWLPNGRSD